MPYSFHDDRALYFEHQTETTKNYIVPFVNRHKPVVADMRVLEIGCGEGGVLKAFTELGCSCSGVELSDNKFAMASEMLANEIQIGQLELVHENIYVESFKTRFKGQFDLIILKDVIEHIPDQKKLMGYLHTFLRPTGVIFLSFPPWQMPFGGHQQMCKSILKKTPWFHLLPKSSYKWVLKQFNESESTIKGLMANKRTGISIGRFERILKREDYQTLDKIFYLINPIYKYKFNLEPQEQISFLSSLPYLRNFVTTAMYYLIQK